MKIKEFVIKNIRCFEGEQRFNIRPITFLMGENSTGKSTVLGCFQTLVDIIRLRRGGGYNPTGTVDFNSEPYEMGTFRDIVREAADDIKKFSLGFNAEYVRNKNFKYSVIISERKHSSEPIIQGVEWQFDDGKITVKRTDSSQDINVTAGKNKNEFIVSGGFIIIDFGLRYGMDGLIGKRGEELNHTQKSFLKFLRNKIMSEEGSLFPIPHSFSIGPIRSEPKRTYNPLGARLTPQGGEIPNILRNVKVSNKRSWNRLKGRLVKFGKSSGLFTGIDVRTFSESPSDPFQLKVEVKGRESNLMDVGYGVSQVLPILVHAILAKEQKLLLQQPEVHLHPKAQAELASLLVNSANMKKNKNSFIIETHSDYMIDRIRIEIMKGKISPKNVSLIFLESVENKVAVHNIEFDRQANLKFEPEGYGEFFQKETDELIGL